jgi:UDPglucose--hexose-1-phosphate uridylyltransferase
MSQLRLDPMTGRWVVIAGERSQRPSDFLPRRLPVQDDRSAPAHSAPAMRTTALRCWRATAPNGAWQVRVVTNRYPAFSGSEPMVVTHLGPVYTQAPASGVHEVLVLAPEHNSSWADLSESHSALVMEALRDRMTAHAAMGLRYGQAVVNSGREAGASIEHPHGQLMSMPFIPGEAANELAGFARFRGNCLLCAVIDAEEDSGARLVHADDQVVMISPFWSGTPYELLIVPRHHEPHLHHADPMLTSPASAGPCSSPWPPCGPVWETSPTTSCSTRRRSGRAGTSIGTSI